MNRREVLTGLGGAAAVGMVMRPDIRALAQAKKDVLTFGQSTAVLTLDPAQGSFTAYPAGYEAGLCIYDRLLDFDAAMKIVPQLAESFDLAPDLMSATIRLRQGATFHDGTPVDSAAVKVNLDRLIDKTRNPTNRPLWDPLASVDTPDARTVVIRLKTPFSQLPNSLAHGSGSIVSPAALQQFGESGIAKNAIGAGPYKVVSFTPGQELVLEAYPGYWGGAPATKRLVFKAITEAATRISALKTGAVDVIDNVPVALVAQLKQDPAVEIVSTPGLRPIGFALNLTREPMKDPRVRQALNLAVPVKTIAEKVFFNFAKAPDSPLAFNTAGYSSVSPLVYDVEKAKALLAEAGYGPSKPLTLKLFTPQGLFPGDVSVAEIVANALQQVGIKVEITKIEGASYWDAVRQDQANVQWDLAMFGFNPSNASGLYHLASLFKSNANDAGKPDVWNMARYRNADVDALLKEADSTPDAAKQNAALAKAQELIWKDNPYIWLQINENVSAIRKGTTGVEVWPIVFTIVRRAKV
ncbi:ABC transporter substrate-binding protein [Microvirga antarctica]|uniref:ABC transporter substrate-binding protein n=1 Tax=Microvirga antarctica TaxID=2819233 RepID=UPI001B3004DF|nr:ABC transporter substrate-binding protein [Microvirga antarctica]